MKSQFMNKKQLIEYLKEKKEYLDIMQKDFGNDSWWYSNRGSEHCINCKVYDWVDTEKIIEILQEKERIAMQLLDIDIEDLCNEIAWGVYGDFEYSIVGLARSNVLEMLQEKYAEIVDITYHGRSGGWACIQYNFDIKSIDGWTLDDTLDEAPFKDLRELKKVVDDAIETINKVNSDYMIAYNKLCKNIEEPKEYVERVVMYIEDRKDEVLEKIDENIELSKKLNALQ